MLQNQFSLRQFLLTKWSFSVHSNARNAPYIHPSHDYILELWRTFPNEASPILKAGDSNPSNGYYGKITSLQAQ